jgi:anti-sigma-K factor RskA
VNRDEVRRNLPWYAAGSLAAEEAAAVEAELGRSPDLRRELQEWQAIESAAAAPRAGEPEFRGHVAQAWARIDAHERSERGRAPRAPLALLGAWLRHTWLATPVGGRVALAVQLALLVAMGATFELAPRAESPYRTLSSGATTVAAGPRLTVAFEPTTTEAQLRALLASIDAEVIAGPTPEQFYTIQLRGRSASAQAALTQLRAAHGVVRFAARDGE